MNKLNLVLGYLNAASIHVTVNQIVHETAEQQHAICTFTRCGTWAKTPLAMAGQTMKCNMGHVGHVTV